MITGMRTSGFNISSRGVSFPLIKGAAWGKQIRDTRFTRYLYPVPSGLPSTSSNYRIDIFLNDGLFFKQVLRLLQVIYFSICRSVILPGYILLMNKDMSHTRGLLIYW